MTCVSLGFLPVAVCRQMRHDGEVMWAAGAGPIKSAVATRSALPNHGAASQLLFHCTSKAVIENVTRIPVSWQGPLSFGIAIGQHGSI